MDLIYAMLIMLGLRHPAPAVYQTPVKALPLIVPADPAVLQIWEWGAPCSP